VNDDAEILRFSNRKEYRTWLMNNHGREAGIWVTFAKGDNEFTANDALEESICFGWIDGLMKSMDEKTYKKYFSRRKDLKNWSEKNMAIFQKMVNSGSMTEAGTKAYMAEKNGEKPTKDIDEKIRILRKALMDHEEVLKLFDEKSPSSRKRFAGFYCDAKTDETRNKRKHKIIEALKTGYTGMLY